MRHLLSRPIVPWSLLAVSLMVHVAVALSSDKPAAPDAAKAAAAAAKPAAAAAAATAAAAAPSDDADAAELIATRARIEGSAARTFQRAVGEDGDKLSAAWARLFVWDVDLRRQLNPGDEVAALWSLEDDGLPTVTAATLNLRGGESFAAYRYTAPGDAYPSYWTAEGVEVPRRLVDGPLASYEQITSLLKDRPKHGGIDFKTPVGTEVLSPGDGVVTRVNWNWKSNGNCVELRLADGTIVKLLHLSKNEVEAGAKVSKGQVVALSGNTGHSTAPHLHYQLEQNGRVIDPLDYHQTMRRQLEGPALAGLKAAVADAERRLAGADLAAR